MVRWVSCGRADKSLIRIIVNLFDEKAVMKRGRRILERSRVCPELTAHEYKQ